MTDATPGRYEMKRTLLCTLRLLAAAAALPALAVDSLGPGFEPGLWRFERSFEYADGRVPEAPIVVERCGDPEESGRKAMEMLRRMGCSYERERTGLETWTQRLSCDRQGLPKGRSTSVMRLTGPGAYEVRIVNDGEMAPPVVRERLTAKRLGDC